MIEHNIYVNKPMCRKAYKSVNLLLPLKAIHFIDFVP